MKGLIGLLQKLFESQQQGFLKRVLAGAGLTLGTTAVTTTLIQSYISKIQSDLSSINGELLAILHISNIDYALSIVLSAILSRAVMNSAGVTLKKKE